MASTVLVSRGPDSRQTKEGHWALPSLWELVAQLGR